MSEITDAFAGTDVMSTPEVAELLDVSQARVRAFADANGVHRVGPAFAWSRADVEAFADELDEAEEDEEPDVRHVQVQGELDELELDDDDDE